MPPYTQIHQRCVLLLYVKWGASLYSSVWLNLFLHTIFSIHFSFIFPFYIFMNTIYTFLAYKCIPYLYHHLYTLLTVKSQFLLSSFFCPFSNPKKKSRKVTCFGTGFSLLPWRKKKFFNKMSQIDIILGEKIIENIENILWYTQALNKLFSDTLYCVMRVAKFRNWLHESIQEVWRKMGIIFHSLHEQFDLWRCNWNKRNNEWNTN